MIVVRSVAFFAVAGAIGYVVTQMRRAHESQRQVLERAADAVVGVGADGRIVFLNPRAETMLGYRSEELVGQSMEVLVPEGLREVHPGYRDRWPSYATITGDTATQNPENEIRPRPRPPMEPNLIERFTENANYRRAIEILGYGHPE